MTNPFANFLFDLPSFLIGFVVATGLWWFLSALRPVINQLKAEGLKHREEVKSRSASGLEDNYRRLAYRQSQRSHIASALFSLDEIILPVQLLAPPAAIEPGQPHFNDTILDGVLPYTPTWPELAAALNAPTLSPAQALARGANIIVTGPPGTGKSVALAHLVSQIVNRDPAAAHLHESIPFLIHVADLDLNPRKPENLLNGIKDKVAESAPVLFVPRIGGFVDYAFQSGRALLLLDGIDELPPEQITEVAGFLKQLLKAHPKTRLVTTALHEQMGGLSSLGLFPLAIVPWNAAGQEAFLEKWAALWEKYITVEAWAQTAIQPVDPFLLNTWIKLDCAGLSPLEFTLKVWGAYAGDLLGPRPLDAIATHIRRLSPVDAPHEAMQILALQSNLTLAPIFDTRKGREWVKSFEPVEAPTPESTPEQPASEEFAPQLPEAKIPQKGKDTPVALPAQSANLISRLTSSGLLEAHRDNNRIRFAHPVISGYLAGLGMAHFNQTGTLTQQPTWTGKLLTARYLAAFGDPTPLIDNLLDQQDLLFARPLFAAARLLRDAPRQAAWRGKVMAALTQILQNAEQPMSLRAQAVAALATSGDPAVAALFRQLASIPSPDLRQLVALGAGALQDTKSIEMLAAFTRDFAPNTRQAACLSLVAVGAHPALEAAAHALLSGDEDTRRAAAEAFATHPGEGYAILKDGASNQDILVRRAVVFGLARVGADWAQDLLQKMQVEDEQWVVRNAAAQALEGLANPNPRIPHYRTPPAETAWVIEFAGRQGMGVTPGQSATDIFLLALKSEKHEEQFGALNYLRFQTSEGVIAAFYALLFSDKYYIREPVFNVLAEMVFNGVKLPDPHQYGLG